MAITRLLHDNGSWDAFEADWTRQCDEIGDVFETYASDALIPIRELAQKPLSDSWAISIQEEGRHTAAFLVHLVNQKGYDAPVLRVRHIVVCPFLDQGYLSSDSYGDTLVALLFEAVKLSESDLKALYIKMHVRSPADLAYFRALGPLLDKQQIFDSTEHKGAWLTIKETSDREDRMTQNQELALYQAIKMAVFEAIEIVGIETIRQMSMFPSSKYNKTNDNEVVKQKAAA